MARPFFALLLTGLVVTGCQREEQPPVTIFAAASIAPAIEQILAGQPHVQISAASSGSLARQISLGAPADLFVSADPHWIALLQDERSSDQVDTLASNALVLIAPADSTHPASWSDLATVTGPIATGDPETVPAGRYAARAMEMAGFLPDLQSRLVYGLDVRHVLLLVQQGEAAAGLVYASDLVGAERVRVVETIPTPLSGPIAYHLMTLDGLDPAVGAVREQLLAPSAAAILAEHGLQPANSQLPRTD